MIRSWCRYLPPSLLLPLLLQLDFHCNLAVSWNTALIWCRSASMKSLFGALLSTFARPQI
jgi:hypothetical protein